MKNNDLRVTQAVRTPSTRRFLPTRPATLAG